MTIHTNLLDRPDPRALTLGSLDILRCGEGETQHLNPTDPSGAACYHLVFPLNAPTRFCQAGQTGEVRAGGYVLLRGDRFYDLSSPSDLARWVVTIPARALRDRLVAVDAHVAGRFRANPEMAAFVLRTISSTAHIFQDNRLPPRPEALAAEIVALTALMIGAEDGCDENLSNVGRSRTRQRIMDHIEAHLGDPDLGPDTISRAVRISRSYLYELLAEGNETVSGFIRSRRLQAAYEMLIGDPRGSVAISEVAYRTGFRSPSHFSRSFTRHFHATPRDIRAGAATLSRPAE